MSPKIAKYNGFVAALDEILGLSESLLSWSLIALRQLELILDWSWQFLCEMSEPC
jgi:hypothetical protein